MCHPHFFYAENIETVYQYMFDNELIDFNYGIINKEEYSVEDIIDIFNKIENEPDASFRSKIFEVPMGKTMVIPKMKLRWRQAWSGGTGYGVGAVSMGAGGESTVNTVQYQDLGQHRQKELDYTVQYVRDLELKKNAFERLKELRDIEDRMRSCTGRLNNMKRGRVGGGDDGGD